jgi:8-oxo-dGTP diphosphatase
MAAQHRNPVPTVDIVVEIVDRPGSVVLIERRNPPFGWALPGGFVEEGEPLWTAAVREAAEEIGLCIELTEQFHTYSDPKRDPRKHTVTTVFLATAKGWPQAGDDAAGAAVFDERTLPALVFDHGRILADYFTYRRHGTRPGPKQ